MVLTSGWEFERSMTKIKTGQSFGGSMQAWLYPSYIYNLKGDGKHSLIINSHSNSRFFGHTWNNTTKEWENDNSILAGISQIVYPEYRLATAFVYNLRGDDTYICILHHITFRGFYWNGISWIEDSTLITGLPSDISRGTSHCILDGINGKTYLITGLSINSLYRAFYWNGSSWIEDTNLASGLSMGVYGRITGGYNIFNNNKWSVILSSMNGTSYKVFTWEETSWIQDTLNESGLYAYNGNSYLYPTVGYNINEDNKWTLISGVGQTAVLVSFIYNTIETNIIPQHTNISVTKVLAVTFSINISYPISWDHKIKYSINSDMSDPLWSDLFIDYYNVSLKVDFLNPNTTYYCEAYTFVPWNETYYAKSPQFTITTLQSITPLNVSPGTNIQDALEMLPLEGGTLQLLDGIHEINYVILLNKNNIHINGSSNTNTEVRIVGDFANNTLFGMHKTYPGAFEDWASRIMLDNISYSNFKVTSTITIGKNIFGIIYAKNISIDNIIDLTTIPEINFVYSLGASSGNPETTGLKAENVSVINCYSEYGGATWFITTNILIDNCIFKHEHIDINRNNSNIYITNCQIYSTHYNYGIRGHGGNHVYILNNILQSGSQWGIWIDGLNDTHIEGNYFRGFSVGGVVLQPQGPRIYTMIKNNIFDSCNAALYTTEYSYGHEDLNSDVYFYNNTVINCKNGINMTSLWIQVNAINNIIINSTEYGIRYVNTTVPSLMNYNNVWNNILGNYLGKTADATDTSINPLFADISTKDFHLKSQYGRYDSATKTFINDTVTSSCISAGDPTFDNSKSYWYLTQPIIELGVYGNTSESSNNQCPTPICNINMTQV